MRQGGVGKQVRKVYITGSYSSYFLLGMMVGMTLGMGVRLRGGLMVTYSSHLSLGQGRQGFC